MNKKVFLGYCLFFASLAAAQTVTPTVLSNAGGYSTSAGGSIEWTIGEPVSDTYKNATNFTTMGFHQNEVEIRTLLAETTGVAGGVLIFPNPVRELLKLNFAGMPAGNYHLRLTDAIGKLIFEHDQLVNDDDHTAEIKMNEIAAGNYFITVSNKTFNQTIQINKIY